MLREQIDTILTELLKQVEQRPCNVNGKKDGNFNYIHRENVTDAFEKISKLIKE